MTTLSDAHKIEARHHELELAADRCMSRKMPSSGKWAHQSDRPNRPGVSLLSEVKMTHWHTGAVPISFCYATIRFIFRRDNPTIAATPLPNSQMAAGTGTGEAVIMNCGLFPANVFELNK